MICICQVRESDIKQEQREHVNHFAQSWHRGWNPSHGGPGEQGEGGEDEGEGEGEDMQQPAQLSSLGMLADTLQASIFPRWGPSP